MKRSSGILMHITSLPSPYGIGSMGKSAFDFIDFLKKAGMPFENIEASGLMMPVLSVECRYKAPLRFGDRFAVYPKITKFNGTTLELDYRIVKCSDGSLCSEGHSSHCFTDSELKPIRTKKNHPDIYKVFHDYVDVEIGGIL